MPITRTETYTIYTFNELSNKAKEVARDWLRDCFDDAEEVFGGAMEDAKHVGLRIDSLRDRRPWEGAFIISATECCEAIFREHGADCATYKTAERFDKARDALPDLPAEDSPDYRETERRICEGMDALEGDFLTEILEDYRVMYQANLDYRNSNEYLDEGLVANEYTFDINGKRKD